MLVCHCAAVNDRVIRAAIAAGAHDLLAVAAYCGAGSFCGGCQPTIVALLVEAGVADPNAPAGSAAEPSSAAATPLQPAARRGPRREPFRSVVRAVEEDVLAAGWVGGQMLGRATELARRYGCTRATLERAVWVLEQHGIVQADPDANGHVRVGRPTAEAIAEAAALHLWSAGTSIDQLIAARRVLEGAMAQSAAATRAAPGVRPLFRWLAGGGESADPRNAALAFHLAVAEASGNPAFAILAHTLIRVTRLHRGSSPRRSALDSSTSTSEHRAIAEAVVSGDRQAAAARSREHIDAFYARSATAREDITGMEPPPNPTSAVELVRALAREIHRRALRPGQLVGSQRELAERYGVAPDMLQQAATLLEYYAVGHQRVGGEGGVVVSAPDPWPTAQLLALYLEHVGVGGEQLFALRRPLELAAARSAGETITPDGAELLRRRLGEERQVQRRGQHPTLGAGHHDVHVVIAEVSGDPVVRLFVDALKLVAVRSVARGGLRTATPSWDARLADDHEAVVHAIVAGDPDAARDRMARHLDWLAASASAAGAGGRAGRD